MTLQKLNYVYTRVPISIPTMYMYTRHKSPD